MKKDRLIFILLIIACISMSIGYATINSITSTVSGEVLAEAQDGIFITSVDYISGDEVSESSSYYAALLYSNIELSDSNDSYVTYQITIYNNSSIDYVFTKTTVDESFYTNDGISYELIDLDVEDALDAYSYITFQIKFYYTDEVAASSSELESYINFEFEHADSYCAINGVSSLSTCLISNDSKADYDESVANIIAKGTPDYSVTAPVSSYDEKTSNGTVTASSTNVYVGTSYSFESSTGAYTLENAKLMLITDIDLTDGNTYYTSNTSSSTAFTIYEIKSLSGNSMSVITHSQSVSSSSGSSGIYRTVDYDGNYTYYYRGEVDNNWVSFGGFLWRVVRINSDGSIRMIYSGIESLSSHTGSYAVIRNSKNSVSSTYSINTSAKYGATYVGYMYNPELEVTTTPSYAIKAEDSEGYSLSNFPTYSGLTSSAYYYFFNNFDLSDCDTEAGTCTMSCTLGDDCIYTTWASLRSDSSNYDTSSSLGSTSTSYYYTSEYKYSCFALESSVVDGDSVTVTCPIVSEILGIITTSSSQVKVRFHGLFSSSYEDATTNSKDSNIKYEVDYWYENNILYKYDDDGNLLTDYIADEVFCNDRSLQTGNGYNFDTNENTKYNPYYRLDTEKSPSLTCANESDRFTVSSSNGNGALKYPVGLITADEVSLAGAVSGSINYNYYLQIGTWYWTMSPAYFNTSNLDTRIIVVNATGNITVNSPSSTLGIRPVINLSSDVLYISGIGTEDYPYIVGLSS